MPLFLNTINRSTLYSLLFLAYLTLSLIRFTWPDQIVNSIIIGTIGLYCLSTIRIDRKLLTLILLFTFALIISFIVSSMMNLRFDRVIQNLIFILASSGIALLLTTGMVSLWAVNIVFWGLASYFIALMLLSTDPMLAIFTSQNGISMMMLVAAISYYSISNSLNQKIDLKPALVTLIVSIWGTGRSGILVSFILFSGLIFLKFNSKIIRASLVIFTILLVFVMSIPLYGDPDKIDAFYQYFNGTFFDNAILNYSKTFDPIYTGRQGIYLNYLQNIDIFKFLFGVNPRTEYWPDGKLLDYNYHNSFMSLHAQTGFFGVIVMFLIILSFFKFLKSDKVFSLLILSFFLRWSVDSYLFFEFFDFIPLFFIFMLFKNFSSVKGIPTCIKSHAVKADGRSG